MQSRVDGEEMTELVSVIIPTYNRATLLRRAINSVLAQTYRPIEIIVVDDGSTDDTSALLLAYGNQIRVFKQPNQGVSSARNLGLQQAHGEYIAFLDSDDLWGRDKVEEQVSTLRANLHAGVCYTWYIMVDATGRFLRAFTPSYDGEIFKHLYFNNFLVTPHILARRICFKDGDSLKVQFDTKFTYGEDWKLWLQLSLTWKYCFVPKYLVCITDHPTRVYKTGQIEQIIKNFSQLESYLWSDPQAIEQMLTLGRAAKAVWPMRNGYLWFLKGDRRKALLGFCETLRLDPRHWPAYIGIMQVILSRALVNQAISLWNAWRHSDLIDVKLLFPDLEISPLQG